MTRVLGLRGATTASANSKSAILTSTKDLLQEIVGSNNLQVKELAAVYFTVTQDLNAEFPALAARQLGWDNVALLCAQEMDVPFLGSLALRSDYRDETQPTVLSSPVVHEEYQAIVKNVIARLEATQKVAE